ncbi:MAG TPA: hypothetical protein VNF68_09180 [Candidatus Baltobacteraceae bacterium]|nr:hypothetical protein [Candidatus Baltobacteraceae bacterium]
MKNLHVAALATLFGISGMAGMLASTTAIAAADQGNGNGQNRNNRNWQNGQCNYNGNMRRGQNDDQNENENENSNNNNNNNNNENENENNQGNQGNQGNLGQNNCYQNGGQQGNTSVRGVIVSVNGNQVRLMAGFGHVVTINDQPALNNRQTGSVSLGRYVTAYGYYQNGMFYATSLQ